MSVLKTAARQRGLTLIELMVSMGLGLLLIAGAVSLTLANRRSHDTNQGLSQVQESARSAFEMLARDVRPLGAAGCGNPTRITNDLLTPTAWWQNWFELRGYDDTTASARAFGTAAGDRISGTNAIQTQGLQGQGYNVAVHNTGAATIEINATSTDIVVNDIILACDGDHTTIFQVSSYTSGTPTIGHATGGTTPGNCSPGLGFPVVCSSPGTVYQFPRNALLARMSATEWYIGNSGRTTDTGRSLFRIRLGSGGVVSATPEEMVADVTNMQVQYYVAGSVNAWRAATVITTAADWALVTAVRITLTVTSADTRITTTPGTNSGRIERSFTQVIALRNRVS